MSKKKYYLIEKAKITLAEEKEKGCDATIAKAFDKLGTAYENVGQQKESLECYKEALEHYKLAHGQQHHLVARSLSWVGFIYDKLGSYEEGLEYKIKSLKMYKSFRNVDERNEAGLLSSIGFSYESLLRYEDSLKCHKEALEIRENIYKDDYHHKIASSKNYLGGAYLKLGEFDLALKLLEEALLISQKCRKDQLTASIYSNLGEYYCATGSMEESLRYYDQSLNKVKDVFTEGHLEYAKILYNFGAAHDKNGSDVKALSYYKQSFEMYKKLAENHPMNKTLENVIHNMKNVEDVERKVIDPTNGITKNLEEIDLSKDIDIHALLIPSRSVEQENQQHTDYKTLGDFEDVE